MREQIRALKRRLLELRAKSPGAIFYWRGGSIREKRLHLTKGWRDNRVERFPMPGLIRRPLPRGYRDGMGKERAAMARKRAVIRQDVRRRLVAAKTALRGAA